MRCGYNTGISCGHNTKYSKKLCGNDFYKTEYSLISLFQDNAPSCDAETGQCVCKDNVTGGRCDRCKNGFMGIENSNGEETPDGKNEFGCTPCFCYNHSNECKASNDFLKDTLTADFSDSKSSQRWTDLNGDPVTHQERVSNMQPSFFRDHDCYE